MVDVLFCPCLLPLALNVRKIIFHSKTILLAKLLLFFEICKEMGKKILLLRFQPPVNVLLTSFQIADLAQTLRRP
jgi:hypothetical protein